VLQAGQTVECHHYVGNSGFFHVKRVIVPRLGKRVTIGVPLVKGGTRKTSVKSESLHPVKA